MDQERRTEIKSVEKHLDPITSENMWALKQNRNTTGGKKQRLCVAVLKQFYQEYLSVDFFGNLVFACAINI